MTENTRLKQKIKEYCLLALGSALFAIGVHFFIFPNHFTMGGAAGISLILNTIFSSISVSVYNNILNTAFLLLGFIALNKNFGIKTIYCSILYIIFYQGLVWFVPMQEPLTDNKLLELIFSIFISAFAGAITFNHNASSGGTDVVAMIIKDRHGVDVGTGQFISNVVIVIFSFFIFDVETALLSLLGLLLKAVLVDSVIHSINRRKMLNIITSTPNVACDFIINKLQRSATVWQGMGAYTHEDKWIVLSVLTPHQAVLLRRHLRKSDPEAFFLASNSSEIFGKGFHQQ